MIRATGTFSNANFGGYEVSGTKYTTEICLGSNNICKLIRVFSGETVSADNWMFNKDGAYGILGVGPNSALWNGFVDPNTLTATYSIELSRVQFFSHEHSLTQVATIPSNVTFGSANDAAYAGQTPLEVTADSSDYSYSVSEFSFGIVYQTNGEDSSEYFEPLSTDYPVIFSTNFKGLGLPANIFAAVVNLVEDVSSGHLTCDYTQDGFCSLPAPCDSYTSFENYSFRIQFSSSDTYMRIPLATFAQNVKSSLGSTTCSIELINLIQQNSQSN